MKPSGPKAAGAKRPPRPRSFFLDHSCSGNEIRDGLRAAGLQVFTLKEVFDPSVADDRWLAHCGRKGWVVLSRDAKIRTGTNPANLLAREAIVRSGVRMFILRAQGAKQPEHVEIVLRAHKTILLACSQYPGPFIAIINRKGEVTFMLGGDSDS
jgi:PIN like domain